MDSTTMKKGLGIALLALGAGLAFWGYEMSGSVGSQLNEAFSGSPTEDVMARYIAGGVSGAVGLFLLLKS